MSALSTRILIEGIISIEGIEVEDDEYQTALEALAAQSDTTAEEVDEALTASGQKEALTGDILRSKALERIASAAEPVDSEGNAVDLKMEA